MNETPNEHETKIPVTDAGHLLEPEAEEPSPVKNAAPIAGEASVVRPQEAPKENAVPPAPPSNHEANNQGSSGGVLVLQWLSYAFWFWCSVSVSVLAGIVINYFISGNKGYQWGNELAYPLASVIILLAIALVTDKLYARHEPAKKNGGANVIMLLHVVPFILIVIGALVTVVFSLITMLLNSDPVATVDGPIKVMLVSLIVAVLFALAATRAFYGSRPKVRLAAWVGMAVLAVGFIAGSVAGPATAALRTKNDRLIEQALPSLSSDIRRYTNEHNKLPGTLSDVTYDESSYSASAVQKLIDSKLVTYKANTLPANNSTYNPGDVSTSVCDTSPTAGVCYSKPTIAPDTNSQKRFYYQLCTTYQREKKSEYNYSEDANYTVGNGAASADDYRYSYVSSINSHPAGEVCYNLYADGDYDSIIEPMSSSTSLSSPKITN